jgi:hypothetical protein
MGQAAHALSHSTEGHATSPSAARDVNACRPSSPHARKCRCQRGKLQQASARESCPHVVPVVHGFATPGSINEIGHLTGKQTIAEWAENAEIIEVLRGLGVDYAQGYGVSQPPGFKCSARNFSISAST